MVTQILQRYNGHTVHITICVLIFLKEPIWYNNIHDYITSNECQSLIIKIQRNYKE